MGRSQTGLRAVAVGALLAALSAVISCGLVFPTVLGETPDDAATGDGLLSSETSSGGDGATASSDASDAGASSSSSSSSSGGSGDSGGDAAPCIPSMTSSDPFNCGACGHDCLGGACDAGVCQAVVLVSNESSPQHVAVDTTSVYWTNFGDSTKTPGWGDGAVRRAAKDGSNPSDLVTATPAAFWILSGGQTLYYDLLYGGRVQGIDPTTAGGVPMTLWSATRPYQHGMALSVDGGALYWVGGEYEGGVLVQGTTLPSGPVTNLSFDTDDQFGALALTVDSTDIYFIAGAQTAKSGLQSVKRMGIAGCPDGGACGVRMYSDALLNGITGDASYVYVADGYMGSIVRLTKGVDGGAPAMILTGLKTPSFLLAQGGWVYWVESVGPNAGTYGGTIGRMRPDGTQAARLATHQTFPLGLAVDGTVLYWVNQGTVASTTRFDNHDGQVLRLAL